MKRFFRFLPDLFGRKKLVETHEEILHEIVTTTEHARVITHKIERSFPISRTIGNPRLRRRMQYVQH